MTFFSRLIAVGMIKGMTMSEQYAVLAVAVYLAGFVAVIAVACYLISKCHIETDPVDSEYEWIDNRQDDSSRRSSMFDNDGSSSLFDRNSTSSADIIYDITYSYMPCNIYYDSFHHD